MFKEFINQLLGFEREPMPNRQDTVTAPDVTEKAVLSEPIPEKYQRDIEALQKKYGKLSSLTGFCISISLKEALTIMPRLRRRIDSFAGLVSYLKKEWDITLSIKSQKTKSEKL